MIIVTDKAAEQIKFSAEQGGMEMLPLRLAADRTTDGGIHYGMGFDDSQHEEDKTFTSSGVTIVVTNKSLELLDGMTIDFVELDDGKKEFVFLNPNDPNYTPPAD